MVTRGPEDPASPPEPPARGTASDRSLPGRLRHAEQRLTRAAADRRSKRSVERVLPDFRQRPDALIGEDP
jgi:hypothetical protein